MAGRAGSAVGSRRRRPAAGGASATTARTVPTSTVSPSGTRISVRYPATGEGTSESTLSVETSNRTSSSATASPMALNHLVMVPSVTVSPSCGISISAMVAFSLDQPCSDRPVRASTLSPNSSLRVGWGWMNSATSSTVAPQLTAR